MHNSHVEQHQKQRYAEDAPRIRLQQQLRQQREMENAQSRDYLDRIIEDLRRNARILTKPRSPGYEEDSSDVKLLASCLKTVVNALIHYEELAKPGVQDPYPLNELAIVLDVATYLPQLIRMMIENTKRVVLARQGKMTNAQINEQKITAGAKDLWTRHPDFTVANIAKILTKGKKGLKLRPNTVEKIIAKLLKTGRLKSPQPSKLNGRLNRNPH